MIKYSKNKLYNQKKQRLTFEDFLRLISNKTGCRPKQCGSNYIFNCLAHDDKHASFSTKLSEDGKKILVYCFAGCTTEEICLSIGIQVKDLFLEGVSHE